MMATLLLATRNSHKTEELRALLGPGWACRNLADFPAAPEVKEDAPTFAGNARLKAETLARWLEQASGAVRPDYVLADDSGLEVDALNGAPGVHSARFARADKESGNSTDSENNAKLLRLLADVPAGKRTARFRCVLALTTIPSATGNMEAPGTRLFDGVCEGAIGFAPSGTNGFGYDPLFIPEGFSRTYAELSEAEKNKCSHRARAAAGLLDYLRAAMTTHFHATAGCS